MKECDPNLNEKGNSGGLVPVKISVEFPSNSLLILCVCWSSFEPGRVREAVDCSFCPFSNPLSGLNNTSREVSPPPPPLQSLNVNQVVAQTGIEKKSLYSSCHIQVQPVSGVWSCSSSFLMLNWSHVRFLVRKHTQLLPAWLKSKRSVSTSCPHVFLLMATSDIWMF